MILSFRIRLFLYSTFIVSSTALVAGSSLPPSPAPSAPVASSTGGTSSGTGTSGTSSGTSSGGTSSGTGTSGTSSGVDPSSGSGDSATPPPSGAAVAVGVGTLTGVSGLVLGGTALGALAAGKKYGFNNLKNKYDISAADSKTGKVVDALKMSAPGFLKNNKFIQKKGWLETKTPLTQANWDGNKPVEAAYQKVQDASKALHEAQAGSGEDVKKAQKTLKTAKKDATAAFKKDQENAPKKGIFTRVLTALDPRRSQEVTNHDVKITHAEQLGRQEARVVVPRSTVSRRL